MRATRPGHFNLLDFIIVIMSSEDYRLRSSALCSSVTYTLTSRSFNWAPPHEGVLDISYPF